MYILLAGLAIYVYHIKSFRSMVPHNGF